MGFIITIFHEVLIRPLFNMLMVIYDFLPFDDLGVSIILLTILTRFVFFPLSQKALRSQRHLTELQPQVKEIQEKHKGNRQEQSRAIMAFYKEHHINPFAGFVPLLIQLPILFALYRVFLNGINGESTIQLYSFISAPEVFNAQFLGIIDLSSPSPVLAIIAGFFMFLQSKITFSQKKTAGKADFQRLMSRQMTYIMPFFTIVIAWNFPAGLPLYWATTTLFSFFQQYSINRSINKERHGSSGNN